MGSRKRGWGMKEKLKFPPSPEKHPKDGERKGEGKKREREKW
jgi:hypothetical protein